MERSPALRTITHNLGTIHQLEPGDSTDGVIGLLHGRAPISVDTETTGLNIYSAGFAVRLVQLGTATEAYVWEPAHFPELTARATTTRPWFGHNAMFDMLALERSCGVPFHESAAHAVDTGIMSRALDPRGRDKGGTGHELKQLAAAYLGLTDVKEARSELGAHAKRVYGLGKDELWAAIPIGDPEYVSYAGQDVLLTSRVGAHLAGLVRRGGLGWLLEFEARLGYDLAHIQRRGVCLDVPYVEKQQTFYQEELARWSETLAAMGVTPTKSGYANARASQLERFLALGVKLTERTKSGGLKLDKDILAEIIAERSGEGEAAELARAIEGAKRAQHYGEAYLGGFLRSLADDGRVHPTVNPLNASTGRMSISDPPLQQIPKDDKTLRGSFVADPGHVLVTADYSAIEYRVGAAVTKDKNMLDTIYAGRDPHNTTAEGLYGPDFTPQQRDIGKRGLFGWLFGGGAKTLSKQTGVPESAGRAMIDGFMRTYPQLQSFRSALTAKLDQGDGSFRSPTGRQLVADYGYKGTNYMIQSAARDIFAEAVVKLFDAGLGDALRLVVHDEMVLSVPEEQAVEAGRVLQDCMRTEWRGVPIDADAEIHERRWTKEKGKKVDDLIGEAA